MSENEKKKLPNGNYKVFIDTKFTKGNLEVAQAVIKGKKRKKFCLAVIYVIHPWQTMSSLGQFY